jgi:hypothetical protein
MQALLVRERIPVLGPAHPDTSYYIRYRYKYGSLHYENCLNLKMVKI